MKFNKIVYLFTLILAVFSLPVYSMKIELGGLGLRPVTPGMFEQRIRSQIQIISEGLFEAIRKNRIDIISGFFQEGVDVNTRIAFEGCICNGFTLLQCAVMMGNRDAMQIILNKGADINATVQSPGYLFHGFTALHLAVFNGDEFMAKTLLEHGADADSVLKSPGDKYNGHTALHIAVLNNLEDTVSVLLTKCADVNKPVSTMLEVEGQVLSFSMPPMGGYTALHFAAMAGNYVLTAMLLSKGAVLSIEARDGKKPFQLAFINGHTDLGFMLMPTRCFFEEECPLCRSNFALGDNVVILPCGHLIQSDCWDLVNANAATANRCVICRTPTARYKEQIFTISSQEILNKFITIKDAAQVGIQP
ncbi:MAG: ankyrin repeat domain-containing protein [bacterium]